MQFQSSDSPISTDNPIFVEKVESTLKKGEPVIILLRYSHHGGACAYFIVKSIKEYSQILQGTHYKDALTVFFSESFPVQGRISVELKNEAIKFLEKVLQDNEEAIFVIRLDSSKIVLEPDNMKVFSEPYQIEEWFNQNPGVPVIVGLLAFWEDNSDEKVTAYVRDFDGQIRRGAY